MANATSYVEQVRAAFILELQGIKSATTTSSVINQTEHTIARETGSFVTDGWATGMTGKIADSGSNNAATFTCTNVAALTLTVSEILVEQSKVQVGSCTLTSTFRSTVKKVYKDLPEGSLPEYPSIIFLFGEMKLQPKDDKWSLYDAHIPFWIVCEIAAPTGTTIDSPLTDEQDMLVHDLLRVIGSLYSKHVNAIPRWNIQKEPEVAVTPIFPTGDNTGEFALYGFLHIRNMNGAFNE